MLWGAGTRRKTSTDGMGVVLLLFFGKGCCDIARMFAVAVWRAKATNKRYPDKDWVCDTLGKECCGIVGTGALAQWSAEAIHKTSPNRMGVVV
jgi:hypothetical protein